MFITLSNLYHMHEIIHIWNISRHMITEECRHHDLAFDFTPINIWLSLEDRQISLVCIAHILPDAFELSRVAFTGTLTSRPASNNGR